MTVGRGSTDLDAFVFTAEDVDELLPVEALMASQAKAYITVFEDDKNTPPRIVLPDDAGGYAFNYAARGPVTRAVVVKVGVLQALPEGDSEAAVRATVFVFDSDSGRLVAVIDGTSLTTLRTAAATAVAVRAMAPSDHAHVAILGSGVQAEAHARIFSAGLPGVRSISMWSPSEDRLRATVARLRKAEVPVDAADSAASTVRDADVIVACTSSFEPVLDVSDLTRAVAVLSVGSVAPERSEVSAEALRGAEVLVDAPGSSAVQCGPVVTGIGRGLIAVDDLIPIGAVLAGQESVRVEPGRPAFFFSLGGGVQDAAAAEVLLTSGRASGRVRRLIVDDSVPGG